MLNALLLHSKASLTSAENSQILRLLRNIFKHSNSISYKIAILLTWSARGEPNMKEMWLAVRINLTGFPSKRRHYGKCVGLILKALYYSRKWFVIVAWFRIQDNEKIITFEATIRKWKNKTWAAPWQWMRNQTNQRW